MRNKLDYGTEAIHKARNSQPAQFRRTGATPLRRSAEHARRRWAASRLAALGAGLDAGRAPLNSAIQSLFPGRRSQLIEGNQPPLQGEVFGMDRLESYARGLAESDTLAAKGSADQPLRVRFQSNRQALFAGHRSFFAAAPQL